MLTRSRRRIRDLSGSSTISSVRLGSRSGRVVPHPAWREASSSPMWSKDALWCDMAMVLGIFAVGSILFGHFEEHRPKWRRLLKVVVVLGVVLGLS